MNRNVVVVLCVVVVITGLLLVGKKASKPPAFRGSHKAEREWLADAFRRRSCHRFHCAGIFFKERSRWQDRLAFFTARQSRGGKFLGHMVRPVQD